MWIVPTCFLYKQVLVYVCSVSWFCCILGPTADWIMTVTEIFCKQLPVVDSKRLVLALLINNADVKFGHSPLDFNILAALI